MVDWLFFFYAHGKAESSWWNGIAQESCSIRDSQEAERETDRMAPGKIYTFQ
jgi:hypothetical protein